MFDDIDGLLLGRYVSGQCTAAEVALVREWLADDPQRAALVAEFEAVWRASGRAPYEWDVDAGWRAHLASREGVRGRKSPGPIDAGHGSGVVKGTVLTLSPRRPTRRGILRGARPGWLAVAAAVLVVAGSAVAVWRMPGRFHLGGPGSAAPAAMTEYATGKGQRASIRLDDGTQIILGTASRLKIPRDYGEAHRDVYLNGVGYFVVAHDPARPFAVHTARAIARDIGTTFGVRAYAAAADAAAPTEVAVAFGSVALAAVNPTSGHAAEAVVLHADDIGRVDQQGQVSAVHDADVTGALAWTTGRLVFRDTPLREVVAELDRWYDLDIRVSDAPAADRRLTASFSDESVPLVVERIALSLNLQVDSHGRTIVFRSRH